MRLKTTVSSKGGGKKESKNVLILLVYKNRFSTLLLVLPLANIHSLNPQICEYVVLNGKGTLQMQLSQGTWVGKIILDYLVDSMQSQGSLQEGSRGVVQRRTCHAGSRGRRDVTVGFEDGRGPLSKASEWPPGTLEACCHLHPAPWDPFWTSAL